MLQEHRPNVLIAALDPPCTVARIPAMLRVGASRVAALCPRDTSLAHSWLVDRRVTIERDESAALAALRGAISREHFDLIVIGDEALLHALSRSPEPWVERVLPFRTDAETRRLILDKNAMLRAVAARGVLVPPFLTVASDAELPHAAEEIGYPLVLKDAAGCAGAGVRRVDRSDELSTAYASLARVGEVAVQRFVGGRPGCTEVLFDHGVPRCWTSALMLEQWPTAFAGCTVRRPIARPGVEMMLHAVGAATGFHGLGGIDWLEDDEGRLYFLEFNARVTHVVGPARRAFGAEFAAMMAGSPPAPHAVELPGRTVPVFPRHLIRALKSRPADVLQWLPFRQTSADLDWRDVGVVASELGNLAAAGVRRMIPRWISAAARSLRSRPARRAAALRPRRSSAPAAVRLPATRRRPR